MFTRAEKGYFALTLFFLATGSGIKAYRHSSIRLGPFPNPAFASEKSAMTAADSASLSGRYDSAPEDTAFPASGNQAQGGDAKHDSTKGGTGALASGKSGASSEPALTSVISRLDQRSGKSGFSGKVNLNQAGAAELTQVKGLGEKTAKAIVDYRKSHGPFRALKDLMQVKGIGEKKLEKLAPFLSL